MSDQLELDENLVDPELDLDGPAETSPIAQLAKPGALTGAFVQRRRERAPRLMETSMPIEIEQPEAAPLAIPVYEAAPEPSRRSRRRSARAGRT